MRHFIAVIALLIATGLQASPELHVIEDFIARELPATGASGAAFAVVDHDRIRTGAWGTTVAGGDDLVTPSTPFLIGSLSKSFTAIALLQLAEAGKLDLDAPVGNYLDAFRDRPAGSISLRQFLGHTSGYSTVQGNALHEIDEANAVGLGEYVQRASRWQPEYPPASRWEYSNLNYQILGEVVEVVSHANYQTYVEDNILAPLGMKDSSVSYGAEPGQAAKGYTPWFGSKRVFQGERSSRINAPAGGVFSSARDMAAFLAMLLNGRDDIISAANKAEMLRPANPASPFYGLGWFIDQEAGTAFHTGLVPGAETTATLLPAEAKGAVVLINANGGIGFGDNQYLRNGVTALALGMPVPKRDAFIGPKATYLLVISLPVFFILCLAWAWFARRSLAAKSGKAGLASLWFPLPAMAILSAVLILLVPKMFGGSVATLMLFQPDFALALVAAASLGLSWAIFRLTVAYWTKAKAAN